MNIGQNLFAEGLRPRDGAQAGRISAGKRGARDRRRTLKDGKTI